MTIESPRPGLSLIASFFRASCMLLVSTMLLPTAQAQDFRTAYENLRDLDHQLESCDQCVARLEAEYEQHLAEAERENDRRAAQGKTISALPTSGGRPEWKRKCCEDKGLCCARDEDCSTDLGQRSKPARVPSSSYQRERSPSYSSAQSSYISSESTQVMIYGAKELITLTVYLGEQVRAGRIRRFAHPELGGGPGRGGERLFTCDQNSMRPGLLGWCGHGNFTGPVHVGIFGAASNADWDVRALMQFGLTLNIIGGSYYGLVQLSPATNVVHNDFSGLLQLAAFNRVDQDFWGLSQLGLINASGTFNGLLQAGLINSAGRAWLLQVGAYNNAGDHYGLQLGAFTNRGGRVNGVAVSPLLNHHEVANGITIGLFNHADEVRGLQLGLANYAGVLSGVQIGVVNIASIGGLPFMPGINLGFGY